MEMNYVLTTLAMCFALCIAGCAQQPPEQTAKPAPDYDAIVETLTQQHYEYIQAWMDLDIDKIDEFWAHDPDITIWGPDERKRVQGWDGPNGVKAWYEKAFSGIAQCDFKIHDLMIKVSKDGTAAVLTLYVENDIIDKNGNPGKITPRVTIVKELRDGRWKQIHGDATYSIAEIRAME